MTSFVAGALDLHGDPEDANHGLYLYDGLTWERVLDDRDFADAIQLTRLPNGHLYANGDGTKAHVFSTDGGKTWALHVGDSTGAEAPVGVAEDDTLYQEIALNPVEVSKSTDHGENWTTGYPAVNYSSRGDGTLDGVWASDSHVWWVEDIGFGASGANYLCRDGVNVGTAPFLSGFDARQMDVRGIYGHADFLLFWDPFGDTPMVAYRYDSGAITALTDPGGGFKLNSMVPITAEIYFANDPIAPKLLRTTDGGVTWTSVLTDSRLSLSGAFSAEAPPFLDFNPSNMDKLVCAAVGGVFTSADGGNP